MNANGEGAALERGLLRPPPTSSHLRCPLPIVDNFNRPNENPLSDGRTLDERRQSAGRDGSLHHREHARLLESTTCTAWRNNCPVRPRRRGRGRGSPPCPGTSNASVCTCASSSPAPRPTTATCCGRTSSRDRPGLARAHRQRRHRQPAHVNQELAAGDTLLLRAKGTTIEAWRNDGSSWSRLGSSTDSTYGAAGVAGIGLRGTTGRLDDFGARTYRRRPASAPSAPQSLQATAGNAPGLARLDAPSSNGGSAITGYRVYRGTAPTRPSPSAPSRRGDELPRHRAHERADLLLQGHRPERDRRERGLERGECDADRPGHAPRVLRSPCRPPPATRQVSLAWTRPPRTAARRSPATACTARPAPGNPRRRLTIASAVVTSFIDTGRTNGTPTTTRSPP